jgi:signal transduction histidine kinase
METKSVSPTRQTEFSPPLTWALDDHSDVGLAWVERSGIVRQKDGSLSAWLPEPGAACFDAPLLAGFDAAWEEMFLCGEKVSFLAVGLLPVLVENVDVEIRPNAAAECALIITSPSRASQFMKDLETQRTRDERIRDEMIAVSNETLRQENEGLRNFSTHAAHDLRAPAGQVAILTAMLRDCLGARLMKEEAEILDDIESSAQRSREMVDGLLELARVNSLPLYRKPVGLMDVVGRGLRPLKMEIARNDAVIKYGLLPEVVAHADLIAGIFQNVVGNSLKYRSKAKPEIIISVDEEWSSATEVGVSVEDNGIGVSAESAARAFDLYYRERNCVSANGFGIGLAVARAIIIRHFGRIEMRPRDSGGTVVRFSLPRVV